MADLQADDDSYDDDGFVYYEITSINPGPALLIATLVFGVSMYILLPCMVSLSTRRSRRRKEVKAAAEAEQAQNIQNEEEEESSDDEISANNRPVGSFKFDSPAPHSDLDERSQSQMSIASLASSLMRETPARKERFGRRARAVMERRDAELNEMEGKLVDTRDSEELCFARQTIDHDEVSFQDAVDAIVVKDGEPPVSGIKYDENVCCGPGAWWKPSALGNHFGKLLSIAEWDYETRRIYKLGFPFFLQALLWGVCEIGRVAIIGRLIGTKELSAYVIVDLLISFTAQFLGGIHESLITLLSHSTGSGNRKLTGEYVQLSMTLYTLFSIPFIVMWYFIMGDTLRLLGFKEDVVEMGESFLVPMLFYRLLWGVSACIHGLLDVIDLEVVSTVVYVLGEATATIALFITAWFWKGVTLQAVGFIYLINMGLVLWATIVLVFLKGWFRRYYSGLFGSCALANGLAVKLMLTTAVYLSAGYVLIYGEWEILTFFARFLGPAEVAAWGILGTLWDVLEQITEAISNAAEVRVAYHLGAGQPEKAKKSAYKSIFIGFVFSLVSTSALFIAGDNISSWLTTDPTLQMLINELIPYFGLGNIFMTMGSMAWTIVGAQGRYRLSTVIAAAGSWLVTIPLAAVFTIVFRINLQGQTTAIVIGYMLSGMTTNLFLFTSNWSKLSDKVIEFNKEHEYILSDDESSSSRSSLSSCSEKGSVGDSPKPPHSSGAEEDGKELQSPMQFL